MEEIEFSWWLFEGRIRQGKNVLPDGLNWLRYFAGNSKSHRENSISFIFLESPHQVDMKNVVKSSKHFFRYFNTLETHSEQQKIRHREQEDSKKGVIEPFYEEETIKANNDDTSIGIQESSFSVYCATVLQKVFRFEIF